MDKKLYSTWMTITSLVLGIMGLVFILVSIFDAGATKLALIIGLLFIALGTLLNVVRLRAGKENKDV